MTVTDHPVTHMAPEAVSPSCFTIDDGNTIIGVMHSKKPVMQDGTLAIHVSISKSRFATVFQVETEDIAEVERVALNKGLEWPAEYFTVPFSAGPFGGKGVHVWQKGAQA